MAEHEAGHRRVCEQCKSYQVNKTLKPKRKVPMEITSTANHPFDKCYLDIVSGHEWVPYAAYAYNTSEHSATGYTPFELVFGHPLPYRLL